QLVSVCDGASPVIPIRSRGSKARCKTEIVPHPYWPLFDVRVRTPRLEIRLPTDDEQNELVAVSDRGIHDPASMPFTTPWTDRVLPYRHRETLQYWWGARANWTPHDWRFTGAVFVDGRPVGAQELMATDFGRLRSVKSGSWLGQEYQGQGLGKEMRSAILHLAFDGLGAREALSGAFFDNEPSLATSRSLGYVFNGEELLLRRDQPDRMINLRLDRDTWSTARRGDILIEGLSEDCLAMFGLPAAR
ncbi:MAG TPA: GNAT family N-acetyltransferase, partial [Acidimicrobiales bacterium]|nr:GNAT family N-acetyltransferase [Acidimicrobiales bacterium]